MNADTVWADDTSEATLVEMAATPPFGSARRFILLRNVEAYRGAGRREDGDAASSGKRVVKPRRRSKAKSTRSRGAASEPSGPSPLVKYLRSPAPGTVLAMISERWDLKRWADDEFYIEAEKAGAVVFCARPVAGELKDWLVSEGVALGIELEAPAALQMIDRAGDEPMLLRRELEKLASYAGEKKRVTVDDVQALTGDLAIPSVFHFLDVLFVERRLSRALSLLNRLLREMHPLQLHAMLLTQLRKIVALKDGCDERIPIGAIAARVRLPLQLASQLRLMAQRTSYGRFAELLRLLALAEAHLKRGRDGRQVLEGLVMECCK